ncbi:MAG: histidine phosphatase family protein [Massilia sp.]|jgi:phosphohistidine phosphatase SixA|nr:histidine phosphatase family protein [Massilia sp.]
MQRRACFGWLTLMAVPTWAVAADGSAQLWRLLRRGGHVILMRHAMTVAGIGDPAGFELGQCATQRNLSEAGRMDAMQLGERFRNNGIPVAIVLSSRWCRCLDTARLAFGRAEPSPMLDSMFRDEADARQRKLLDVRAYLGSAMGAGNIVMVTHDVNLQALVGRYMRQGEMAVAAVEADGALRVIGTWFVAGSRLTGNVQ